eukprot:CAMPEP_0115641018 /NCGR_PEP_ID=MMETSP0272-20121206/36092_1 /TAXON_ID=71861 /ORGANISM="Scrippsiella trochoidea, Strain CCMP3099" /LENGTH=203 /DNA_ID=CAMNT_0003078289 /DNA_START=544 /DNA_END=1156 /DNA_ORIENTATION=-
MGSDDWAQALWQENGIRIHLHQPIMFFVVLVVNNALPDSNEDPRIEGAVGVTAKLHCEICFHHPGCDTGSDLHCDIAVDRPIIAPENAGFLLMLELKQLLSYDLGTMREKQKIDPPDAATCGLRVAGNFALDGGRPDTRPGFAGVAVGLPPFSQHWLGQPSSPASFTHVKDWHFSGDVVQAHVPPSIDLVLDVGLHLAAPARV